MKKIKDGSTWGDWTLDGKVMLLSLRRKGRSDRWINLLEITSEAKLLHEIFHIQTKPWLKNGAMRDLLRAFEDLLEPRRTLMGKKGFDPAAHLRERLEKS